MQKESKSKRKDIISFLDSASKMPNVRRREYRKRIVYDIYSDHDHTDTTVVVEKKKLSRSVRSENGESILTDEIIIDAVKKVDISVRKKPQTVLRITLKGGFTMTIAVDGLVNGKVPNETVNEMVIADEAPAPVIADSELASSLDLDDGVVIYTDGSCGTEGKRKGIGTWCYVIVKDGKKIAEARNLKEKTTSAEMEYLAVYYALKAAKRMELKEFTVCSDYKAIVDKMSIAKLIKRNRDGSIIDDGPNRDLLNKLVLYTDTMDAVVHWEWIRGHSGNRWNVYCDNLAKTLMRKASA